MFIDTDGIPDDIVGATVILALALGDVADTEVMPIAVLLKEFVRSPEEGDTLDEVILDEVMGDPDGLETDDMAEELVLADTVGSPDGAELVGNPLDELFEEIAGKPEEADEL